MHRNYYNYKNNQFNNNTNNYRKFHNPNFKGQHYQHYQNQQNGNWRRQQFWPRRQNETGKGKELNRLRFQPRSISLSQAIKELIEVAPEFGQIFSPHGIEPGKCVKPACQLPNDDPLDEAENVTKNVFDQFHPVTPKENREVTSDYGSNSGDSEGEHKFSSSGRNIVRFPVIQENDLKDEVIYKNQVEGDSQESQELVKQDRCWEEERVANSNSTKESIFITPITQDEKYVILQSAEPVEDYGSELMLGLMQNCFVTTNDGDQTEVIFVTDEGSEYVQWEENLENETHEEQLETFDLELGAVEVVGNEDSVVVTENESPSEPATVIEKTADVDSGQRPNSRARRRSRKRPRPKALQERNTFLEKVPEKDPIYRNLIQPWPSVLEKTLLVRVVRCDSQLKQSLNNFSQEVLKEDDEGSPSSPTPTPPQAAILQTAFAQHDSQSADLIVSDENDTGETNNVSQTEEVWNIVQETPTTQDDTLESGKIKLKIKRRRVQGPPPNAKSLQFFGGLCQVCGCACDFASSQTYYYCNSGDLPKAKMCYTCFESFSDADWEEHDNNCLVTDDEFEQTDGSLINAGKCLKRKNYICSACFESLSNSETY